MSETKHTPGPWKIQEAFNRIETEQEIICTVDGWELRNGKANARLIAAAPGLLDALEKIRNLERRNFREAWDMLQEVDRLATAAIRKVEGESQ